MAGIEKTSNPTIAHLYNSRVEVTSLTDRRADTIDFLCYYVSVALLRLSFRQTSLQTD